MTALSKRRSTLILIPALAVSAVASARGLDGGDDDTMTLTVLAQSEDGRPSHANFGPYDVEVDGVAEDSFHFELQLAEEAAWIAACAIGDSTQLLCSFYDPAADAHAFLVVDGRDGGLDGGTLQGPGVQAVVDSGRTGWTLVDRGVEAAGVDLRGRNKVWFDRGGDLESQSLLAAAAGALLVFDGLRP